MSDAVAVAIVAAVVPTVTIIASTVIQWRQVRTVADETKREVLGKLGDVLRAVHDSAPNADEAPTQTRKRKRGTRTARTHDYR